MAPKSVTCCVVGGGPAGITLGLLLARAGVEVAVLEKHADFLRDFRGDTVHPSTLTLLDELGLFAEFDKLPQYRAHGIAVGTPDGPMPFADLGGLSVPHPYVAFVPQWDFLNLLAGHAQTYPAFHLITEAEADDVIVEGGAIRGVRYRTADGEHELRAKLTVAADGRHSAVRAAAGLEPVEMATPMDVLWFRLPRVETDTEETFLQFGAGQMMVAINRGTYWQLAYLIRKGSAEKLRAQDISALRTPVAELLPFLSDRVDRLTSWDDTSVLQVGLNRLRRWHRPGLLCIGDAAHTMSPIAGVGINLAVQDAVATANALADGLLRTQRDGVPLDGRAVIGVQRRRSVPATITQRVQQIIQNRVITPTLSGEAKTPAFFRLVSSMPAARRVLRRFVGLGVLPEHIRTPDVARR
ncbi:MAG TPA: FAD-dependent oxidoreductase [Streptosporangiaceae bacterium]